MTTIADDRNTPELDARAGLDKLATPHRGPRAACGRTAGRSGTAGELTTD